jgi:hypothetical protein
MNTATVPEPGHLYRYTGHEADSLILVTEVETWTACWIVRGYRVTPGYRLTGEAVQEDGPIGAPHGVRYDAFCAATGDVPFTRESPQRPLFSAVFPASDYSDVRAVEALGRKRHMAAAS